MSVRLVLIRHGESLANTENLLGRVSHSPLTTHGEKQAQALGAFWKAKGFQFDHVFASTAVRAMNTCYLACEVGPFKNKKEVVLLPELEEIHRGQFEGIPVHVAFTPEVNKERFKDIQHWKPAGEGAETQEEVGHRMFKFVSEKVLPLATNSNGKPIVVGIFSHGMAIRCLLVRLAGLDPKLTHFSLQNTSVTELILDNGLWIIKDLNSTHHLEDNKSKKF